MLSTIRRINRSVSSFYRCVTPAFVYNRLDAELFSILSFVKFASSQIKKTDRILDAGAGPCPYKTYFSHACYESTDIEEIYDAKAEYRHTFICNLDKIPQPNNFYDAVLSTQVLEHVENPQKVIKEFYRILKPEGKLFITVPLTEGVHGSPSHFFNFTKYGLKSLFLNAGFQIQFVKPRGGIFHMLGKRSTILPDYILKQFITDKKGECARFRLNPLFFIILPVYVLSLPICLFLIPLFFFYLDRLDARQDYTLGYSCYCTKNKRKA